MSSSKLSASASSFLPREDLPFLPQEIVAEIVSKLPAKSLMQFKCVSKFFSSLIVDHPFADLHRNCSLTLPSRMSILLHMRRSSHYTINYSEENQGILHANHLQYIDLFRRVYITSSLNGLICFCARSRYQDAIAIHNLSTRHHISLPSTCPNVSMSGNGITAVGLLGFDSVLRRYKVLKLVDYTHYVKYWVFTLGVDESWREIHSSSSYHPYNYFNNFFYSRTSVHIDGVIYFFNSLNKGELVAFDVRAENFQTILPPPITIIPGLWIEDQCGQSRLVEIDGRLAFIDLLISDDHDNLTLLPYGMRIWILEESMVWKNLYSIPIPIPWQEIDESMTDVLEVATNHVGEIAVLMRQRQKASPISILFYNFRRESWRKFDICELPYHPCLAMYFILDHVS